jgi:hypothetical protein
LIHQNGNKPTNKTPKGTQTMTTQTTTALPTYVIKSLANNPNNDNNGKLEAMAFELLSAGMQWNVASAAALCKVKPEYKYEVQMLFNPSDLNKARNSKQYNAEVARLSA